MVTISFNWTPRYFANAQLSTTPINQFSRSSKKVKYNAERFQKHNFLKNRKESSKNEET